MSLEASRTIFERVNNIAPERLYDERELRDQDRRYVIFEYNLDEGIGVITADEIRHILEKGQERGQKFPLFKGIEASEAYVRTAVKNGEGLMTSRIEDGEVYSTGYMIQDDDLKALMAFSTD